MSLIEDARERCDIYLLPKDDKIIVFRRSTNKVIDTILSVRWQDGFPGWGADFSVIDDWVWSFVDVDEFSASLGIRRNKEPSEEPSPVKVGKKLSEETKGKISKRPNPAKGEKHGMAVLTAEKVLEIVRMHDNKGSSQRAIAKHFGVWRGTVSAILYGWTWSHVTGRSDTRERNCSTATNRE